MLQLSLYKSFLRLSSSSSSSGEEARHGVILVVEDHGVLPPYMLPAFRSHMIHYIIDTIMSELVICVCVCVYTCEKNTYFHACMNILTIINSAGICVAMDGMHDGTLAQLDRLIHTHVESIIATQCNI